MKIISWNIRGANGKSKQRLLKNRILKDKPTIVMIQETKCASNTMKEMALHYWKGCEAVAPSMAGFSGDLAILWNPTLVTMANFTEIGSNHG
jgi:exonuclease III